MKVWKKSLLMLVALIALILGTVAIYAATVSRTAFSSLATTYTSLGSKNPTAALKAKKPLTILLMGIDTRGGAGSWDGNSDSQIVLTLNPKTETATMVSMERDTPTNILDKDSKVVSTQKMNAAYPMGYNAGGLTDAVSYAKKTIGEQAGVNIDNFVTINFDGLVNLVNDVGGIDVTNDSGGVDAYAGTAKGDKVNVDGKDVDSGAIYISNTEPEYKAVVPYNDGKPQRINGEQALVFARDRDTLQNGDYGRAAHQREVITQLMKKMLTMNNISQYQRFLKDISNDFKTDIAIDGSTLPSLLAYKDCFKNVVSVQYQGVGETWQGASYQFMPEQVDLAVQNIMRRSLGQTQTSKLHEHLITYESEFSGIPAAYFLPSAAITTGGRTKTMGIKADGSLVKITANNANDYVASNGNAQSPGNTTSVTDSLPSVDDSSGNGISQ